MNRQILKKTLKIYFLALMSILAVILAIAGICEIRRRLKPEGQVFLEVPEEDAPEILEIYALANFWNADKTVESSRLTRMRLNEPLCVGNLRRAYKSGGIDEAKSAGEVYRYYVSDIGNSVNFDIKADGELCARYSAAAFTKPLIYKSGKSEAVQATSPDESAVGRYEMTLSLDPVHESFNDSDGTDGFDPSLWNNVYTEYLRDVFPGLTIRGSESDSIDPDFRNFRRRVCETALYVELTDKNSGRVLANAVIRLTFRGMWENDAGNPVYDTLYELGIGTDPESCGGTVAELVEYWQTDQN